MRVVARCVGSPVPGGPVGDGGSVTGGSRPARAHPVAAPVGPGRMMIR